MAAEAKRIVQDYLNNMYPLEGGFPTVAVVESETVERPYGWFFFYNAVQALEMGNMGHSLIGNGPILVRRGDGKVVEFSSFYSVNAAVTAYEADPAKFQPRT
ncbi:YrhB domain-containing protein [Actinoallomurus sp. CA-142502]|uniref:YrhB domain-containing protein n=1 Tax=Actinoallomurus sp. CA-142502 TaxID=3239885 RepID=UPI003D92D66A